MSLVSTFQRVDKWSFTRKWLDMSSCCVIRFKKCYFHPFSQLSRNWRFLLETCNSTFNSMYISKNGKQTICYDVIEPIRYPIRFQKYITILFLGTVLLSYFAIIPFWRKLSPLHFNIFDSSLPKDTLCQDWWELAKWFLSRRLLSHHCISLCAYYLPLEKCKEKSNKFEFPLPKNSLCHV